MRSLLMVGALLFAVAGSAMAQDYPKGEVAGNYTYVRINPGGGVPHFDCHGGGGSAAWSLNHYLGVVGEFSGCKVTGLPSGVSGGTRESLCSGQAYPSALSPTSASVRLTRGL